MKRILMISIVVTILLAVMVGSALAANWFVVADLSNTDLTGGGYCWSFNEEMPGGWGGEYGEGAVTAFPGDEDDAGYCSFNAKGKVSKIELRVLDGIADDSFAVHMKNPKGKFKEIFTYTDEGTTETWIIHEIVVPLKFRNATRTYGTIIKILPTGPHWAGFDTYGQLAVDKVSVTR